MIVAFKKYHALGNDYLVISPADLGQNPAAELIRLICDRHRGPGADGVLVGPLPSGAADFGLQIFNPDGSQAEKSGNGLRIFARHLWEGGCVPVAGGTESSRFTIETPGGVASALVLDHGRKVQIGMGKPSFDSRLIPMVGPPRQVVNEPFEIAGEHLQICGVNLGNPHCVVLCAATSPETTKRLGPLIEIDQRFPSRTNVQFMKVINRGEIEIQIWERGAGYTLASGSSSCAAAAAAHRLGLVDTAVTVHNPGGDQQVNFDSNLNLTLTGPVEKVFEGWMEVDAC